MITKIQIDNLVLHDLTDPTCPYMIESPVQGLEMPSIRTASFNKPGQDGVFVTNQFFGERRITLTGMIKRSTDIVTTRRALISTLSPSKSNSILNKKTLTFTANSGEYQVDVQCLGVKMEIKDIDIADFQIDLLAVDDNILSTTVKSYQIELPVPGGFVLPVIVPISLDPSSGGNLSADNSGDVDTYPIVKFYGPLTNPVIENVSVGKKVKLDYTLPAGSSIVIDMFNRTIVENENVNRIGKRTIDSRFLSLQTGVNTLYFESDDLNESGYCVVEYRDAWKGI